MGHGCCACNAALWLASKFEEVNICSVQSLRHVSANAYTRQEIVDFEVELLQAVDFQVRHRWGKA